MSTFDVAKRILQIRQIEERIDALKLKHIEELKPYNDFTKQARGEVLAFLAASGQRNAKTINGTGYEIHKCTYTVENSMEFRRHIIGTEAWDLADWRTHKAGTEAFRIATGGKWVNIGASKPWLVGGLLPPGVKKSEEITLGVLAPAKPKTGAVTTKPQTANQPEVETL